MIRNPFARDVFHGSMPFPDVSGGGGMIDEVFKAVPGAKKSTSGISGTYPFPQSTSRRSEPLLEKRGVRSRPRTVRRSGERLYRATDFICAPADAGDYHLGTFTEAGFAIKQAPEKGLTDVAWVVDGSPPTTPSYPIIGKENQPTDRLLQRALFPAPDRCSQ